MAACRKGGTDARFIEGENWISYAPLLERPSSRLLFPRSVAVALPSLLEDPEEGYFEHLSLADLRLQWPDYPSDSVDIVQYKAWLGQQVADWPNDLQQRVAELWQQVLVESEALFPGLAPDTLVLIALQDAPYGSHIYFTRQNAVLLPISDLRQREEADLLLIFRHELFHLISRARKAARDDLYAIANYQPLLAPLVWENPLYTRRLINPDAPNFDYALNREGQLFVPLLYCPDTLVESSASDRFAVNLRFSFLALSGDTVTQRVLPEWHAKAASNANSDYFIHPEEVLAEHFSFLLSQQKVLYPEELVALRQLLEVL